MKKEEQRPARKRKESFIRWQGITIEQLTYAINLILTLSTAALGFAVSLLISNDFKPTNPSRTGMTLFVLSVTALFVSIAFGIWCVINRLKDFRLTRRVADEREDGATDEQLKPLRDEYDMYGRRTWVLFWFQIGSFAFAILAFILSIAGMYWNKWH
ncbi:MAG TPA: hypothetical protein VK619_03280 [Pyrinomonadaceae bacterium]|nr:hypothetical protein [Pyrinomonadaceae bacterium]